MKYIVIGDIHGDFHKLNRLLEETDKSRKHIFLGDYINRGNQSFQVVDLLVKFKELYPESIFLLGNHEYAFLKYINTGGNFVEFANIGGLATLKSYLPIPIGDVQQQLIKQIPTKHLNFLNSLELYYENNYYLMSHSGVNPTNLKSRQLNDLVLNFNFSKQKNISSLDKIIICGHYLQKSMIPYMSDKLICLDTGCGTINGPISSVLLPEMEFKSIS